MKSLKQKNRGQCLITAHAMCMEMTVEDVITEIGHDGMEKVHPNLEEPFCYRGFHEQEIIDQAYLHNVGIIHIDALPGALSGGSAGDEVYVVEFPKSHEDRILEYLNSSDCAIILGKSLTTDVWHAVAWDGTCIYDPQGRIYTIEEAEENRFGSVLAVLIYKEF